MNLRPAAWRPSSVGHFHLDQVCAEASAPDELVQVANDNCPGQVVISGAKLAVERAMAGAKAAGAKRALPLAVSIAAHSPLMAPIQEEWNDAVNRAEFSALQMAVIGNVHAQPLTDETSARADIIAQMQSRVRWTESVLYMVSKEINTFVEAVHWNCDLADWLSARISDGMTILPLGNPQDFDGISRQWNNVVPQEILTFMSRYIVLSKNLPPAHIVVSFCYYAHHTCPCNSGGYIRRIAFVHTR